MKRIGRREEMKRSRREKRLGWLIVSQKLISSLSRNSLALSNVYSAVVARAVSARLASSLVHAGWPPLHLGWLSNSSKTLAVWLCLANESAARRRRGGKRGAASKAVAKIWWLLICGWLTAQMPRLAWRGVASASAAGWLAAASYKLAAARLAGCASQTSVAVSCSAGCRCGVSLKVKKK